LLYARLQKAFETLKSNQPIYKKPENIEIDANYDDIHQKVENVCKNIEITKDYYDAKEQLIEVQSELRATTISREIKDDRIISIGYNGMPAGWTNECEDYIQLSDDTVTTKTKPEVIHAEANAIAKLARGTESGGGATMFLTHAPCVDCAKQMYTAGIKQVYYRNTYKDTHGIEFLQKCHIEVTKV
jgi:dCMP deaminase